MDLPDTTLEAIAVGRDVFLPDSTVLIELLMRIQSRFNVSLSSCHADVSI